MKIEMICSVDPAKDFVKIKGDKSGRFWFDTDASQAAKLVQLVLVPDSEQIKITVEVVKHAIIGGKV